jgi:hypothetical protein
MADKPEDLLQRLEKLGQDGVGNYGMPICAEAAAELRRLHVENERLKAEVLMEREACADICDQHASVEGIAQRCAEQIRARSGT